MQIDVFKLFSKVYQHFGKPPVGDKYGRGRDWNVDLIPKFLMANGMEMQVPVRDLISKFLMTNSW